MSLESELQLSRRQSVMNQIAMQCSMRTIKPLQAKVQALGWPAHPLIVPPLKRLEGYRFNRARVHAAALPALLSLGPQPCSLQLPEISLQLGAIPPLALTPSALASWATTAPAAQSPLLANLATALQPSCFDAACQQEKDTLLLARLAHSFLQ